MTERRSRRQPSQSTSAELNALTGGVAWVAVPELIVTASPQRYDAGTPIAGGGAQIRFASGGFVEHIEVDADGVVVSYPSIGNQLVA